MNEPPLCTKVDEYLLICLCKENQLILVATGNGQFWRNTYTEKGLQSIKPQSTMTLKEYRDKLLSALKLHHPTEPQFTIKLVGSNLQVVWSKEVKKGVEINFGTFSLSVTESVTETLQDIVESLATQISHLAEQNSRLTEEQEKLRKVTDSAIQKYEELVGETEAREGLLLKHFVTILNEKKRKIAELQGSPVTHKVTEVCSINEPSEPESVPKQVDEEDSVGDGEELLPKIPRTSKTLLHRAIPTRRTVKTKAGKPAPTTAGTTSCSATNASLDELLDSL